MLKKILVFTSMFFLFCTMFANPNPTEKLCAVKIEEVLVVVNNDVVALKVNLKNPVDKTYKVDLSYQIFELSPAQKLVCEKIKAQAVEISAKQNKQIEIQDIDFKPVKNSSYKINVILTYKPEVFIGFFNNDKIIDVKTLTYTLQAQSTQND